MFFNKTKKEKIFKSFFFKLHGLIYMYITRGHSLYFFSKVPLKKKNDLFLKIIFRIILYD